MNSNELNQYEVLSPWAEVDPKPMRGITPRLEGLSGKKIGLFYNGKRAAHPIMMVVEQQLKEKYPNSAISHFIFPQNREIIGLEDEIRLKLWAKEVDGVVSAVGD